jgi:transcriptional regulator with PAS, ATPase and Fis domain
MESAIMKHTHIKIIDQLLSNSKSFITNTQTQTPENATIKDFTGVKTACKIELSIVDNAAILTHIKGNTEDVLGWQREKLIGKDLLALMGVKTETVNKAYRDLQENNFAYKENTFLDQYGKEVHTQSILMWREHNSRIVEFVWRKQ